MNEKFESGKFYHIYNRTNNNELLFKSDRNYSYFLNKFKENLSGYIDVYAYCLLPNHFHFLIKVKEAKDIAAILTEQFRKLFIGYTMAFNKEYGRKGNLFQRQFKRKEISDEQYLAQVICYINCNSLKHKVNTDYANYDWSSYKNTVNRKTSLIDIYWLVEWFGNMDRFIDFHKEHANKISVEMDLEMTSFEKMSSLDTSIQNKQSLENQIQQLDTITAIATPQGEGAIGIIRLSGDNAITICNTIFKGKDLSEQESHTIHYGEIVDGEKIIDEVMLAVFIAPHSYTKENAVEISCHGSTYILEQIINLLLSKGVRIANPGEFTLRAYLNGRMDLSQAEAVTDLIASSSEASHNMALQQMRGGYSKKINELRKQLIDFASMIELELDFSEEDVEFADRSKLTQLLDEITDILKPLIDSFKLGNVLKNGVPLVIAGRPNAGKSTLLNALLQEERALVSDIPGTTRDTIEETFNINGVLFRLIDTAGIRDTVDNIEQMGVQRTFDKINQASLVVYLFDVNNINKKELDADIKTLNLPKDKLIMVGNKIDLASNKKWKKEFNGLDILFISAKAVDNLEGFKNKLAQSVINKQHNHEDIIVSNARHFDLLNKSQSALEKVRVGIENGIESELIALDIRTALDYLGQITGAVTTDDLLGNIFSRFCIGK